MEFAKVIRDKIIKEIAQRESNEFVKYSKTATDEELIVIMLLALYEQL